MASGEVVDEVEENAWASPPRPVTEILVGRARHSRRGMACPVAAGTAALARAAVLCARPAQACLRSIIMPSHAVAVPQGSRRRVLRTAKLVELAHLSLLRVADSNDTAGHTLLDID